MAAYAALVSLINNIEQIMNHPRLSVSLDGKYMQPLLEKAGFLLDFIECNNYGGVSTEAADLERQISSAAHAAEDEIELHVVDQIHAGTSEISHSCSLDLQQIIQEMDAIMVKITMLKKNWGFKEEKSIHPTGTLMEGGGTSMVGLDDELIQLMDELTGYQPNRHIISIVGMGGIGKTTLARNIYQNQLVLEHFDIRAWATISQQHNIKEVLSQLLDSMGKSQTGNAGELGVSLHKILWGRRYLIVLDNIWSVEAWDGVSRYFPNDGNRSRVILTTRLLNVASVCGSSCFKMILLDEDKSWKLFCEKTSFPQKEDPPQLEDVGKEIVRLCKGLALSIVVIGGLLLKSPRTIGYWSHVVEDLKSIPSSKEKQEMLDVLSLSYNHLPPHLKSCFLYMGLLREDSRIQNGFRVSNIVKLWVAEGFLKSNASLLPEEVGEGYIEDLIDRNLILAVKRRYNGKIGSCGIHDLLIDLCLKVAEHEEFIHLKLRRYKECCLRNNPLDLVQTGVELPLIRSILEPTIFMDPSKFKLLRVLDESTRPHKSVDYYRNVNLRYLAYYEQVKPCELPPSLSLIWNLQTFIIRRNSLVVAPTEFWKMYQLRHVECYVIYLPHPPPSNELLMLENLQTLKTVLNLRLSEEVCKLIPNIRKLHLLYDGDSHGYVKSMIKCLCNLDRLHKLQSLNLTYWPTPYTKLNKIVRFPAWLSKLSLRECRLDWEELTVIGSLLRLEVLKLDFRSVTTGREWAPLEGQFLRLKFLKIHCCNLIHWIADSSHFPVLERLVLNHLRELEEIPSGIGDIPTLELIRVIFCNESAAISAVKIKEDQLESQQNEGLQVQVSVFNEDVESFKERLESEGLTTDNIQFQKFNDIGSAWNNLNIF